MRSNCPCELLASPSSAVDSPNTVFVIPLRPHRNRPKPYNLIGRQRVAGHRRANVILAIRIKARVLGGVSKRPAAVGSLTTVFVARRICPSGVQSDGFCERLGSDPKPFAHLGLAFCFIGVWSFLAP